MITPLIFTVVFLLHYGAVANGSDFARSRDRVLFLQTIKVDSPTEAATIWSQIRAGESFDELASRYAPEGLNEKSGYLGKAYERNLDPRIRKAISGLQVGDISEAIELDEGFLFVRLLMPQQAASYEAPMGSADYYIVLGLNLGEILDEEGEIGAYQKAIELDPKKAEAYVNLGEVYRRKGLRKPANGGREATELLDKAIDYFKLALKLDPEFPEAHYNLGLAYSAEGLLGLALLEFEEALRLRPGDGEILKSIAGALYLKGDYEEAWIHVQKAKDMGAYVDLLAYEIAKALRERASEEKGISR
jgi:tetratricopeptide (TPR) repeat protein